MKKNVFFESLSSLGILLLILILINVVADRFSAKLDITEEKLFSLSAGTKNILDGIEGELNIKYYFSANSESAPLNVKAYGKRVKELLEEYVYHSQGKIKLEIIDPKPDTEEEEWASKDGIAQIPLPSGEMFYMGAVVRPGGQAVKMFDPRRESFLEYDISEMVLRSTSPGKKTIGILSSISVVGSSMQFQIPGQPAPKKDWGFVKQLKNVYNVKEIKTDSVEIPDDVDLLLTMHPKGLSETTQYAIDQFVMNGGRLIVLVDPSSQADEGRGSSKSSNLSRLFNTWKIKYNSNFLVADMNNATKVGTPSGMPVDYPIWLNLDQQAMASENVAVSDLDSIMMIEAGSLEASQNSSIAFLPLIQSSSEAMILPVNDIDRSDPFAVIQKITPGTTRKTIAGMYSGEFESAFSKAPTKEGDSPSYSKPHKSRVSQASNLLVVADTDFLQNRYSMEEMRLGNLVLGVRPLNDNLNFMLNSVEFMLGNNDLISVRSRGKFSKPFERVVELQKEAQLRYKSKEEELTQSLKRVQQEINRIQDHQIKGNKVILSQDQIAKIQEFKEQELQIKRERRDVRRKLREDIESLGQKLTFINVFLIPILVGVFGAYRIVTINSRRG